MTTRVVAQLLISVEVQFMARLGEGGAFGKGMGYVSW